MLRAYIFQQSVARLYAPSPPRMIRILAHTIKDGGKVYFIQKNTPPENLEKYSSKHHKNTPGNPVPRGKITFSNYANNILQAGNHSERGR